MNDAEGLLSEGLYSEAVTLLEELRAERPDELSVLNNLSVAYRRAGREEQSFEVLQDGLRRHPDYYPFHLNISVAFELRGEADLALQHLRRAVEIDPTRGATYERMGNLLLGMQRRTEALEAYEKALEHVADKPTLLTNAAVLQAESGHWDEAAERAERAVAAAPETVSAWIVLGRARAEVGRFVEAQAALDRAARLAPGHPVLVTTQGRLETLRSGG
jgi:tetratricopeptide (TPR) repeat protein